MFPYFVTLFFVLILALAADKNMPLFDAESGQVRSGNPRNYQLFVFASALILILVSGFRYDVGTDYMAYSRAYHSLADNVWAELISFKEPGLAIIAWISHFISSDYVMMFLIVAAITVGLNTRVISKHSGSFAFGILLYLFIGSWHNSFNAVRQYLAAAILFAGHRYILDRKFIKYLIVVFIAMLTHTTALAMLPVYFMVGRRFTIKNAIIILLATVVLRFSYDYLFGIMSSLKGSDQTQYTYMNTEVNAFRVLVTIPPLFLYFLIPKERRTNAEMEFYMSLLVVNAGFMIAMRDSAYLARLGIYTETYTAIAIPLFTHELNARNRKLVTAAVLFLYFIYWVYEIHTRDSLNNFQWIFNR